jgi:hypothetical protein
MVARRIPIPESAFISEAFSAEALFDEYDVEMGGQPDKLWIQDDANATLTDWRKSQQGERIAPRFLKLYDCHAISERFRHNKDGLRTVPETSTSILFAATYNVACFQKQEVREGLASRFTYYVAESPGRLIVRPRRRDDLGLDALATRFGELERLDGEMNFSPRAELLWEQHQKGNHYEKHQTDRLNSAKHWRLSRAPMQALKLAMIFEATRSARNATSPLFGPGGAWRGIVEEGTLICAIEHIKGCLAAAEFLDSIANRAEIAQEAEILLSHVRREFAPRDRFIIVPRTDLTRRFCNNSGRRGSWKPDDLYLRFIPHLQERLEAWPLGKHGKQEWFAFRKE